jgi:hypothetical protein
MSENGSDLSLRIETPNKKENKTWFIYISIDIDVM